MKKMNLTTFAGLWFGVGGLLTIAITLYLMYTPAADPVVIASVLIVGTMAACFFGRQWGPLILRLDKSKKSMLLAGCYGIIVGFCTLFVIIFFRPFLDFHFWNDLGNAVRAKDGLKILLILIKLPLLSLFVTIVGFLIEPLVLLASVCGGVLLYCLSDFIKKNN